MFVKLTLTLHKYLGFVAPKRLAVTLHRRSREGRIYVAAFKKETRMAPRK
jgi:hypothetical protein